MKLQTSLLKIAISAIVAVCALTPLKAEKHYVPGMGTYGVTNEKTTCSRCGATYTKGDGHWCERPDRTTHHSSTSSSAIDREAQAAIDGDPTLLSNQCSFNYTYDANAGYDEDNNDGRSDASKVLNDYRHGRIPKKESHTGRNILIGIAALAGAWWLFFRRRK